MSESEALEAKPRREALNSAIDRLIAAWHEARADLATSLGRNDQEMLTTALAKMNAVIQELAKQREAA